MGFDIKTENLCSTKAEKSFRGMVAARALRRSLLDPHLRAYASHDRLQGRRPPLPATVLY
jgi:hypothetical protein